MLLVMPQNTVGSFYEKTDWFIGPLFYKEIFYKERCGIFNDYARSYDHLHDDVTDEVEML